MSVSNQPRTLIEPVFLPLGQISYHNAQMYADVAATTQSGKVTSWSQFEKFANQIANGIQANGISKSRRIAYIGKTTDYAFQIMHGVAKAECVFTPINWRLTADEVDYILSDADPAIIFVSNEFSGLIADEWEKKAHIIVMDDAGKSSFVAWRDVQATASCLPDPELDDIVLQIYTSGTTGVPKGALWSHNYFVSAAKLIHQLDEQVFGMYPGEEYVNFMPIFHVAGTLSAHYHPSVRGCGTVILPDFDAAEIFRAISTRPIPVLFGVPTMFQLYLEHPEFAKADLSSIRYCSYGGAPMPLELRDRMSQHMSCRFSQIYGATESSYVTTLDPEDHLDRSERMRSVGRPLNGVEVKIINPEGNPLPPGEAGEIAVRSPLMFSGYHNQPEATKKAFRDGWYLTGDGGYVDDDGYLFLKDRVKDLIISGGENIYPAEVEAVLARVPGVLSAAVVALEDDKWGEVPVGFIVPSAKDAVSLQALDKYAREHLAKFKVPKRYKLVGELPQNALGKIQKNILREMARVDSDWLMQ